MADATMQDLIKEVKLVSDRETKATQDVFNAVGKLNQSVLDFINLQKQSMLDDLEARREAANKQAGEQSRSESSKKDSGGLGLPGLAGFAIPALVGLVASLTDADQLLRGFALPRIFKNLVRVVTGIADGVRDALKFVSSFPGRIARAFNAIADIFPKITFDPGALSMRLQNFILDIGVKIEQIGNAIGDFFKAAKAGAVARAQRIADAVGDFFRPVRQAFDNFKAGAIERVQNVFNSVTDTIKTIRDGFTNAFTRISTAIKNVFTFDGPPGFITKIFDDVKSIFGSFKIEMPDWIKNFEIPGIATIKSFFVGTEAGGGILGFFGKIADLAGPILAPLKTVGRYIGGPITQLIMGIVDFFVGFYEGFVGKQEFDEDGNAMGDSRGFMEKIQDGLIGGVKGLIKGITEAIDLIFIGIPMWIAEQLGFDKAAEALQKLWDKDGITGFVDPIFDWLMNLPQIVMDLIPTGEEIKNTVIGMIAALPGGRTILSTLGILDEKTAAGLDLKDKIQDATSEKEEAELNLAEQQKKSAEKLAKMNADYEERLASRLAMREKLIAERDELVKAGKTESTMFGRDVTDVDAELKRLEVQDTQSKERLEQARMALRERDAKAAAELKAAQDELAQVEAEARAFTGGIVDASSKTTNNNNNSTTIQTGALPPPRDTTDRGIAFAG